jgi:mannose-6-phosphate isomerase-like protein (cupin superfamily)
MPVFKSGQGFAPKWCEMKYFESILVPVGGRHTFSRIGLREKLIVARGKGTISVAGRKLPAAENAGFDLAAAGGNFEVIETFEPLLLIRMCGDWGEPTGGSGLFEVQNSDSPKDQGDAVDYQKTTNFDRHYHDCDEYWIVLTGSGVAVSEGKFYELHRGDCLATGMGHHHDFPIVREPVRAVYFETTLQGRKRLGHLWNHTHGQAHPNPDRV